MKRIALIALPLVVLAWVVAGLIVLRRSSRGRRAPTAAPGRAHEWAGNGSSGVEVLVGYDERHEAVLEARHGALLHLDVGRLSVAQI